MIMVSITWAPEAQSWTKGEMVSKKILASDKHNKLEIQCRVVRAEARAMKLVDSRGTRDVCKYD